MNLFKKSGALDSAKFPEKYSIESLGNAIFFGVLLVVAFISIPMWFLIVDELGKDWIKNVALTLVVLDLMCAWLVADMIKKWFNTKRLAIALSLGLLISAGVLWFTDDKIWALIIGLFVCMTDTMIFLKWLSERFLERLSHEEETED